MKIIVTSALFFAASGFGLWAAATTTDRTTADHFPVQMNSQLELPR
jgi:hypothetical protein